MSILPDIKKVADRNEESYKSPIYRKLYPKLIKAEVINPKNIIQTVDGTEYYKLDHTAIGAKIFFERSLNAYCIEPHGDQAFEMNWVYFD